MHRSVPGALGRALLSALLGVLAACSADTELDFSERLTFVMFGSYEEPEGASGNADPKFVNISFVDASLTKADGSIVDLFDGEPISLRIISRAQVLHEVDMSAYVDTELSAISVSFDPSLTAGGKLEDAMPSTLETTTVSSDTPLVIEAAIQKRMEIRLQWQNTVTLDTANEPPTENFGIPGLSATLIDE